MHNKEELIREQRISEAMINGYIGQQGKFSYILRWLGDPIVEQNDLCNYSDEWRFDVYDQSDKDVMPELTEDTVTSEIGYFFDGLKYGYNIDLKYDNLTREIKVIYDGKVVYKEENGELLAYVPNSIWESNIKSLCEIAKKVETRRKEFINSELKRQIKDKKHNIYKDLNEKWGI